MPDRGPKAYEYYKDLAQRAEYLLVGIIAASVAFFWREGEPAKLGFNPSTLHLAGLLFLFAAVLVALSRLHAQPGVFAYMAEDLDLADERAALVKSASEGKLVVGSYGVLHLPEQIKRIELLDQKRAAVGAAMDKLNRQCIRLYKLRNGLLLVGYSLFLVERIWLPYY
jgi:hypothetical protein